LRPTITIQFDAKFQIIAQLFDSIRNEKNTIRTSLAASLTEDQQPSQFNQSSVSCRPLSQKN